MAKLETKLHCGQCKTGIVTLVVSKIKRKGGIDISATVKECDLCKAFYGLKGISSLKQVITNESNSLQER